MSLQLRLTTQSFQLFQSAGARLLVAMTALACAPALAAQQTTVATRPAKIAAGSSEQETVRYLQVPVAVVNSHPVTRRDFICALAIEHPKLIDPKLPDKPGLLGAVSSQTLAAACKEALKYDTRSYNAVIQNLMLLRGLEDAALAHHVPVSQTEVNQRLHEDLDLRRRAEEIPATKDDDILRLLGTSRQYAEPAYKRTVLIEHLILADLNERLGHPIRPDDFYSSHYLYIAARSDENAATPADLEAAKSRLEKLRQAIVNKDISFEEATARNGDDNTRSIKGDLGPLPRTLMKKELESVLLTPSPGDITPVIRINNGYGIARLDKRGAMLTEAERKTALKRCLSRAKRKNEVLAKMLKDVHWKNYLGASPSLASLTTSTQ